MRKITILTLSILMISMFVIGPLSTGTCTLNLPTAAVTLMVADGTDSYFISTLMNVPDGYDVGNIVYPSWCVDVRYNIPRDPTTHTVMLYSSGDPPAFLDGESWDMVNYILNNKQGSTLDIQHAIWYFVKINGQGWKWHILAGYTVTPEAIAMVDDALANGTDFVPEPLNVRAVICVPDTETQITIIELRLRGSEGPTPPRARVTALTIYSSPTGVTFTVDGVSRTTPWSGTYCEGASVSLVMPETHDEYVWSHWLEDGDPNKIKTDTMDTNITLTAVFTETTPPTISIISPENKTYPVEDVPLTFTVSESTSWIGYIFDGQANITIAGNTTLTGLSDGMHSLVVYASDIAGNIGSSDMVYFTIQTTPTDTTPPTISIVSPENKTYDTTDIPLTFTVDESVLWIGYSLDGQANTTITGNTTLSGLSNGSHSLIVYAKDTAGNTGASEMVYFSITTLQPEPFPWWILGAIAGIAVIGIALGTFFLRRRKSVKS